MRVREVWGDETRGQITGELVGCGQESGFDPATPFLTTGKSSLRSSSSLALSGFGVTFLWSPHRMGPEVSSSVCIACLGASALTPSAGDTSLR